MFWIWNFIRDLKRLRLWRIVERKRSCECWLDECWHSCRGGCKHIASTAADSCFAGFYSRSSIGRDMLQEFLACWRGFIDCKLSGDLGLKVKLSRMSWQVTHTNPFQKKISQRPQSIERRNNGRTMDSIVKIKSPLRYPSSYCKNWSSIIPCFFRSQRIQEMSINVHIFKIIQVWSRNCACSSLVLARLWLKSLSHVSYDFLFWPVVATFAAITARCAERVDTCFWMFLPFLLDFCIFLFRFCGVLMLFWLETLWTVQFVLTIPAELFVTAFTMIFLSSRNSLFVWAEQVFQCFYSFYSILELALGDYTGDLQLIQQIHFFGSSALINCF